MQSIISDRRIGPEYLVIHDAATTEGGQGMHDRAGVPGVRNSSDSMTPCIANALPRGFQKIVRGEFGLGGSDVTDPIEELVILHPAREAGQLQVRVEVDQPWKDDGVLQSQLFCIGRARHGFVRADVRDTMVFNEKRAVYDRRSVNRVDGGGETEETQRLIRPEMPKWNWCTGQRSVGSVPGRNHST